MGTSSPKKIEFLENTTGHASFLLPNSRTNLIPLREVFDVKTDQVVNEKKSSKKLYKG